ncbi:MAG: amidohydrolase family protein [Saprospiraceae bacterium]
MKGQVIKIHADTIHNGYQFIENSVLLVDRSGKILLLDDYEKHDSSSILHLEGIVCPGFINTHCHLELSHMKGKVDTGTGLIPFIQKVVSQRNHDITQIHDAIQLADTEMFENGIVAVGDISNTSDTVEVKNHSPISYFTFVEMFDFLSPSHTSKIIEQYEAVYNSFSSSVKNKISKVPHAPYSVSKGLFSYLNDANPDGSIISIHNQETKEENDMFVNGNKVFLDFFSNFGITDSTFSITGKSAIHTILKNVKSTLTPLLVHNTNTSESDIIAANQYFDKVFWVTCPNANLYIENSLPCYKYFINQNALMTIGTDSLTSNWKLSIWDEICTLRKYASHIPLEKTIRWATLNGAMALGMDDTLGSFDINKTPGIVHIDHHNNVKRIF